MTDRIETQEETDAMITAMDDLLSGPMAPVSIQDFWSQSVSASVMSDYSEGRVVNA